MTFTINGHLTALVLGTIVLFLTGNPLTGNLVVVSILSLYDMSITPRHMPWQMW